MARAIIRLFQAQDLEAVKELYTAYTTFIGVDLSFQNYQAEFDGLPGKYTPQFGGALYVAEKIDDDIIDATTGLAKTEVIGTLAFRRLSESRCELKRLYVKTNARGLRAGHALVEAAMKDARAQGYTSIVLDSLNWLTTALAIYEKEGFAIIEPYYYNPHDGVVFLEKILEQPAQNSSTFASQERRSITQHNSILVPP